MCGMRTRLIRLFLAIFFSSCAAAFAITPNKHVLVVVWDGMRPDFVTEQNTPALWKLAKRGVVFRNNHAVYPSATNVNGTALMTGDYPGHNGLIANHDYRPEIDEKKSIEVETQRAVQKGDEISGGKYVAAPTIAQLVRSAGGSTAIAAAKTVGLLLDRQVAVDRDKKSVALFAGETLPPNLLPTLLSALGPFPRKHLEQGPWTTKALTDCFWKNDVPNFSVLWLGEPDLTQHETAPGAPEALAAIKTSDNDLASALAALDRHHIFDSTDVFVVSDHGFSTIERAVDMRKILTDAKFDAVTEFVTEPKPGQVMIVGNGGTVLFYVIDHDAAVIRRLVELLQQTDFAGVIFTREPMEGTFTFDKAGIDNAHAPDVEMSFGWNDKPNQFGIPGMIDADWQRAASHGTHATLSKFDLHNTLIVAGPDFKNGLTSELPSGNVDIAPTITKILGIDNAPRMDGRILSEAMASNESAPKSETETIEATRNFSSGSWRQTLKISRVGSTIYLDEGNGVWRTTAKTK
jgi:arylsulfatase A-like enzyme